MIRRPPRSTRLTHSFPTRRSSDLRAEREREKLQRPQFAVVELEQAVIGARREQQHVARAVGPPLRHQSPTTGTTAPWMALARSEEHTSELQSLMRISYAVFCLKKKKTNKKQTQAKKQTQ